MTSPANQWVLTLVDECIGKFERKYADEAQGNFHIKDYVTDLLGIRVICIYESDILRVREIIKNNFLVIDVTDKSNALETHDNQFGYKGLHLDVKLSETRLQLPEYKSFRDLKFEIQVRSIVQDAWSEVDHKLKYKKRIPGDLRRRIYRLAALFELADQEFESIRNLTSQLEASGAKTASSAKSEKGKKEPAPLTPFTFLPVAREFFPEYPFEAHAVDGFVDEVLSLAPNYLVSSFRADLEKNLGRVSEYADYLKTQGHKMNPYTRMRHALALADSHFSRLLFSNHRMNFERWQRYGTVHPAEVVEPRGVKTEDKQPSIHDDGGSE